MPVKFNAIAATILGAALSTSSISAAYADSLMEKATGDGLDVAFYNFIPYAYEDESGTLTGTDVDTLRAVLERMGGTIGSSGATEWGALIPGVKTGRFDVVAAGMYVTPKRCEEVMFSEPTFGILDAFVVAEGNPHNISNYESIAANAELKLGVVAGSAQVGYAQMGGVADDNIIQLPDNPTGMAALAAGRIHAYSVSLPGVRQIIAARPDDPIEATAPFGEVAGQKIVSHGAFAFRKDDAEFVEAFNKELTAFVGTPEHIAIMEKHGMTADELPISSTAELCAG